MPDYEGLLRLANSRVDRAVLNIGEVMRRDEAITPERFIGSVTRVVIAANTVAQLLSHPEADDETSNAAAALLWRLGEQLNIITDGAER